VTGSERKPGFTLLELVLVLALTTLITSVAVPWANRFRDGISVGSASAEAYALFGIARHSAILRARGTVLEIDTVGRRILVLSGTDTLRARPLGALHGVRLEASGLTTSYAPNGLGVGVSNLTLIIRKGRAADTLTVSRLGRVRR
jgi:prepilin-type N-terminal cleavage/methylation domain-containing protein